MNTFTKRGANLRIEAKKIVFEFMRISYLCQPNREGMRLSEIFRVCGFNWGEYENATSSNQQYWLVARMRELKEEGRVVRLPSKKWRFC
ncbi:hypothetical protein AGMMS50289_23400 [Betaproteobacteria bacterium]|nr:hypothetical protein AGMMS50289_23400 [Betaproteobacteria bacterium]